MENYIQYHVRYEDVFSSMYVSLVNETIEWILDFLAGSCLLQVVHGVFKTEFKVVSLDLLKVLIATYSFFNDKAAQKDNYIRENESAAFSNP